MRYKTTLKPTSALIDLTPLVDVVLLMLVFFIITSDILPLKSLDIEPPPLPLKTNEKTAKIVVVMDAQNVIYVGSKKEIVDLDSFKESLQKEISKHQRGYPQASPTVVLSIDRRVEYGPFLRLLAQAQTLCPNLRLVYHDTSDA